LVVISYVFVRLGLTFSDELQNIVFFKEDNNFARGKKVSK